MIDGPHPFEWIFVVGCMGAFCFSFGTGSNDVANAFATSVGSGALTMNQAIFIAAIFETAGAMVLGHTNVNTIAGGIADREQFSDGNSPYLFCYGLMWTLWIGGAFQLFASRQQLNVSATHSVIGGIIGFALVHSGANGVLWAVSQPAAVPPYAGVVPIIVAWFFSPIFGGIVSFTIFVTLRTFVLRSSTPVKRTYFVLPVMIFITVWINVYFVFTKGAKAQLADEMWTAQQNAWVAAVVAIGCSLLSILCIPWLMNRVEQRLDRMRKEAEDADALRRDLENTAMGSVSTPTAPPLAPSLSDGGIRGVGGGEIERFEADEFDMSYLSEEPVLAAEDRERIDRENMMDEFDPTRAEAFDREAEIVFSYLQICTAIAVIFAHGANEVGYATGPLSTIYDVIRSSSGRDQPPTLSKYTYPEYWLIAISTVGLVSGLALYGQRLTLGMGFKLAKLSASRGFSAELATAIVITITAQYGLPTSSSQTITGAIVGVGMAEGADVGVNWKYFLFNFTAWVFTLVVMGLITAFMYSQGVYAPMQPNY